MLASDRTAGPMALQNGRNRLMTDPAASQLGAVAAVYLLWFVSWLVLGQEMFGPAYYNWAQTLVAAAAALLAFRASRQAAGRTRFPRRDRARPRAARGILGRLFARRRSPLPSLRHARRAELPDVSYALFVFTFVCAWGYLALKLWRRRPPSALTGVVFALLITGLAVILANFYYPAYRSSLRSWAGSTPSRPAWSSQPWRSAWRAF